MIFSDWRLHRTKTDEATADPDWAGLNDVPVEPVGSAAIVTSAPAIAIGAMPITGVEVVVLGTTSGRVPVDRAANVCDISLVEVISRADWDTNGNNPATEAALVVDTAAVAAVPLNRKVFIELNGAASFCVRISGNTGIAGVDRLQVWLRFVSR